jgi:cysteine synthase A
MNRKHRPKICQNILETIGNTPLVRLNKLAHGVGAEILLKLEFFNPLSSVKDRIGLAMIEAAEESGQLRAGGTLVEPTSGNTGILALSLSSPLGSLACAEPSPRQKRLSLKIPTM